MITNGFLMRSTNSVLRTPLRSRPKRLIDDFSKPKHQPASARLKTLDDFSRPNADMSTKSFADFTKKNSHYSSSCDSEHTQNEMTAEIRRNQSSKQNDANIYQPIWMFKTIGTAVDCDSLNDFDTCENESDELTTHDASEWEVAQEEFLFSTQRIDVSPRDVSHASTETNSVYGKAHYNTICILYNTVNPNWNEIIFDYNGNSVKRNTDAHRVQLNSVGEESKYELVGQYFNRPQMQAQNDMKRPKCDIKLESVNAWKSMLRAVDYNEDEEDVVSF